MKHGWYLAWGKRGLDLLLAGVSALVLAPLLVLTAIAIHVEDRGPALFRQRRSGRNGTEFTLLKFRSMPIGTPEVPSARSDLVRITRVGRLIRRTNIDELPQLWNILRGDMSVVGPRPALTSQDALLELRARNGTSRCRPGLTGLAQVSSYDGMSLEEKAQCDAEYAKRVSLWFDISITLRTVAYLFRRPPVY